MILRDKNWEQRVLAYDPEAGDKGESDVRVIKDKIVIARVVNVCVDCGMPIKPRTKIRVMTGVDGKIIRTIRTCQDCCDAMAIFDEDGGEALVNRYSVVHRKP